MNPVIVVDRTHQALTWDILDHLIAGCTVLKTTDVHVVFAPSPNDAKSSRGEWYQEYERQRRLWNLMTPLCGLLGATVTVAPTRQLAETVVRQAPAVYPAGWKVGSEKLVSTTISAVQQARQKARRDPPPTLKAPGWARRALKPYVDGLGKIATLTMRHVDWATEYNTDVRHWSGVAKVLEDQDYEVVVIPDATDPIGYDWYLNEGLAERCTFPSVALDPALRLAMYEASALNVAPIPGPASLLIHSAVPYRIMVDPALVCEQHRVKYERAGIKVGAGNVPWARADQRLVWCSQEQFSKHLKDAV